MADVLCGCGCGKPAPIYYENNAGKGRVKGQAAQYRAGHSGRRWQPSNGFTKQCQRCQAIKPVDQFFRNIRSEDGLQSCCSVCSAEMKHEYRNGKGRDVVLRARHKHTLKTYGITPEQYWAMHENQGGLCAICRKPETATRNGRTKLLHVDHDHDTGKVRGLLCGRCNCGIGYFRDDVDVMRLAINYLEKGMRK